MPVRYDQELPPGPAGGHRRLRRGVGVFGGVFKVVIPGNMAPVADRAHPTDPRFNQAFAEYAQDPGLRDRPGPGPAASRQAPRRADGAIRPRQLRRRRAVHRPG